MFPSRLWGGLGGEVFSHNANHSRDALASEFCNEGHEICRLQNKREAKRLARLALALLQDVGISHFRS